MRTPSIWFELRRYTYANHSPAAILRINQKMLILKEIYAGAPLYGRVTFQKSRVLDILGWPPPSGCSLHHRRTVLESQTCFHGTVVEREAPFTNDPGGTGRTGSGILADVEAFAWGQVVTTQPLTPWMGLAAKPITPAQYRER